VLDGAAARRTDALVAVSDRLAKELPRALRISPQKVLCIPNGVDTDLYRPTADTGALRRELGLPAPTVVIGSIGRLEPVKGYDGMLDAFAEFSRRPAGREAVLVVAGEGSTRSALDAQIQRLGLSGRVHLLGWRSDVNDLLSAFSVFTMSSMSEGTSISLLEAMSMGLPPVVTDVGGNAAVLGPALSGGLVPFGNSKALADAWEATLASRDASEKASRAARERVVTAFGLQAVAAAYERLYLASVGDHRSSSHDAPLAEAAK
jgi:glycosyltransferase involved in cell wall biosynthesis